MITRFFNRWAPLTAAVILVLRLTLVPSLSLGEARADASGSADPSAVGPYGVASLNEGIYDGARGRSVGLLTLFPSADGRSPARDGAPYPLIIFSHGFLLRGEQYRSYGEHLASHGFVVALPTYSASLLGFSHVELKNDLLFVIDYYLRVNATAGQWLEGAIDPERIGTSGHSLGGKLSLFAAAEDSRIKASATLDPVDGGPPGGGDPSRFPSVAPEMMGGLQVPLLFIGNDLSREALSGSGTPCAPEEENYERFFEAANPPAIEVTQLGVGHMQYLDNPDCGFACSVCVRGSTPSEEVRAKAQAYLTAFYLGHLKGLDGALAWLDWTLQADEAAGKITVRRK